MLGVERTIFVLLFVGFGLGYVAGEFAERAYVNHKITILIQLDLPAPMRLDEGAFAMSAKLVLVQRWRHMHLRRSGLCQISAANRGTKLGAERHEGRNNWRGAGQSRPRSVPRWGGTYHLTCRPSAPTVGDHVKPRIAASYAEGKLLPMLPPPST